MIHRRLAILNFYGAEFDAVNVQKVCIHYTMKNNQTKTKLMLQVGIYLLHNQTKDNDSTVYVFD